MDDIEDIEDFEDFENVTDTERGTLEETEDATYRTTKNFMGREKVLSYPYSSAKDFKSLTPEQIITRRLNLINPDIDAGFSAKKFLSEPQRKALLRLMSIKKTVDGLPKEKQDKFRYNLIFQYEMSQPEKEHIEMLLDEARLNIRSDEIKERDYDNLAARVKKTFSRGGLKKSRRIKKSKSRKSKSRKLKSRKSRKSKSKKSKKLKSRIY